MKPEAIHIIEPELPLNLLSLNFELDVKKFDAIRSGYIHA